MRYAERRSPNQPLWIRLTLGLAMLAVLFGAGFYFYLYTEVKQRFSARRWSVPSRVFSATVPLYPGQTLSLAQLKQLLDERRYQEALREPLQAGEYKISRGSLIAHLRQFRFPGRSLPAQRVQFDFQQNRLWKLRAQQGELPFLELEPLEVTRLFGPERESRLLISIHQAPRHLIDSVLAIEDHRFYEHGAVDWWGILRALWTDLRALKVVQGGSTITQQLVKNYFLEPERSFKRKFLEVSMALILEALYKKDEILEAYLNEIYLGQRGSVAIHGMGEAARYYFGRNVEDLSLAESATLAGIIRAPNAYSPFLHRQAAVDRRNTVLKRMMDLEKVTPPAYQRAIGEPLRVSDALIPVNVAPYFVDYVRQQLQELYEPEVLESEGLSIYTTLHPEMALAAEAAVKEGLEALEREFPELAAESSKEPLQAALVAVQPRTGAVLTLVGGRDYAASSFNRAVAALRQPGSLIKPFVYLSALDQFTLMSWLSDEPTTYMVEGQPWLPRNYDDKYRGRVTVREALEGSLNAATVSLAMSIGLDPIIADLRGLGIQSPLQPLPSLALGAFEVTPLELAGAYTALSNDGQKPYLLSLKEVVTEGGEIQERRHVDLTTVTTPAKAYLVTNMLEGVLARGTGRSVKSMGIDFPCAVKTGTTSDYRDSWFVGYTTDILVLVWVGFDDNRPTRLSGARGAARIWARFFNHIRPWINPRPFPIPPGVVQRIVCSQSGQLALLSCPQKRLEVFLSDHVVKEDCILHRKE